MSKFLNNHLIGVILMPNGYFLKKPQIFSVIKQVVTQLYKNRLAYDFSRNTIETSFKPESNKERGGTRVRIRQIRTGDK